MARWTQHGPGDCRRKVARKQANALPGLTTPGAAVVEHAFHSANALTIAAGKFFPVIVHFEFELGARRLRGHQYMFSDEAFYRDEQGQQWALVDPRHPRLTSWLVSERSSW